MRLELRLLHPEWAVHLADEPVDTGPIGLFVICAPGSILVGQRDGVDRPRPLRVDDNARDRLMGTHDLTRFVRDRLQDLAD